MKDDVPVVEMRGGLLGVPEYTQFTLIKMNEEGLVYRLQSLEDESINFVVVPSVSQCRPRASRQIMSGNLRSGSMPT